MWIARASAKKSAGPPRHENRRILHSGAEAQDKGDATSHGLQDPSIRAVFSMKVLLGLEFVVSEGRLLLAEPQVHFKRPQSTLQETPNTI